MLKAIFFGLALQLLSLFCYGQDTPQLSAQKATSPSTPRFTSCGQAAGYKKYYSSMGITKPDEYYSCPLPDVWDKVAGAMVKFSTCDEAKIQKELNEYSHTYLSEDNYTCPPDYELTKDEMYSAIAHEISPVEQTANWVRVGSDNGGVIYYMPKYTKHRKDGVVSAWFFTAAISPSGLNGVNSARSEKDQIYANCQDGTLASNQQLFYSNLDGSGKVIQSTAVIPATLKYLDIVPDSVGEMMLNTACSNSGSQPQKHAKKPAKTP